MGLFIELVIIAVYILGNVAVFWYYFTNPGRKFNVVLHLLCPLISSIALAIVAYKGIVPLPTYPSSVGAILTVIWIVVGVTAVIVRRRNIVAATAPASL